MSASSKSGEDIDFIAILHKITFFEHPPLTNGDDPTQGKIRLGSALLQHCRQSLGFFNMYLKPAYIGKPEMNSYHFLASADSSSVMSITSPVSGWASS